MHLDYDKLEAGQTIKRKTLTPGDIQGYLKLNLPEPIEDIAATPSSPSDLSSAWTVDPSKLDARISGHTHAHSNGMTIDHTGIMLGSNGRANVNISGISGLQEYGALSYVNGSGIAFTNADTFIIHGSDKKTVVEFDLLRGIVNIDPNANLQMAAQIFWKTIASSNGSLVPRSEYHRVNNTNAELREELSRTQALLEKSLKALGDKYNEELAVSEPVEF